MAGSTHIWEEIAGFRCCQHFSLRNLRTNTPQYTLPPNRKTAEKIRNLSFLSNLTAPAVSFLSGFIAISIRGKVVKVTLLQALRLCTGRMAHRDSRGIALLFLDYGTRRG